VKENDGVGVRVATRAGVGDGGGTRVRTDLGNGVGIREGARVGGGVGTFILFFLFRRGSACSRWVFASEEKSQVLPTPFSPVFVVLSDLRGSSSVALQPVSSSLASEQGDDDKA